MALRPEEYELLGSWLPRGTGVAGDSIEERIQSLIRDHLVRLGESDDGWQTLYLDPSDGRYWELSYPRSEMHGGGPARLAALTLDEAKQRFTEVDLSAG